MSEQTMDQTDDDGFTHDVSDEALEAAGVNDESGPIISIPVLFFHAC